MVSDLDKMFADIDNHNQMMTNARFSRKPTAAAYASPANRETVSRFNSAAKNEARTAVYTGRPIPPNKKQVIRRRWRSISDATARGALIYTGITILPTAPVAGVALIALSCTSKEMLISFKHGLEAWKKSKKDNPQMGMVARFNKAMSVADKSYEKFTEEHHKEASARIAKLKNTIKKQAVLTGKIAAVTVAAPVLPLGLLSRDVRQSFIIGLDKWNESKRNHPQMKKMQRFKNAVSCMNKHLKKSNNIAKAKNAAFWAKMNRNSPNR